MKKYNLILVLILSLSFVIFSCKKKEEEEEEEETTYQETEDNNSFGSATVLTFSEDYDAEINPVQDLDYFKVTASGNVTITVAGKGTLCVRVHCFDQDQIDFFGGDAADRGETLTKTVSGTDYNGFFYVRVESAYGTDTGSYTIKVNS